jgi:hypothetical protein
LAQIEKKVQPLQPKISQTAYPLMNTAQLLFRLLRAMLLSTTVPATVGIILNLLGLLDPIMGVFSFPVIFFTRRQAFFKLGIAYLCGIDNMLPMLANPFL